MADFLLKKLKIVCFDRSYKNISATKQFQIYKRDDDIEFLDLFTPELVTQEATDNMKKWLLENFSNKKIRVKCMIARADLEMIDFEVDNFTVLTFHLSFN